MDRVGDLAELLLEQIEIIVENFGGGLPGIYRLCSRIRLGQLQECIQCNRQVVDGGSAHHEELLRTQLFGTRQDRENRFPDSLDLRPQGGGYAVMHRRELARESISDLAS